MDEKTVGQLADRIVRDFPDHPARGLARKLHLATQKAVTIDQARGLIRYRLGVKGKKDRRYSKSPRAPRAAGQAPPPLPATIAAEWVPYQLNVTGRVGILSDIHCPYHSDTAVAAAVDHLLDAGISALLLNGDICDFYAISRWMKDPRQRCLKTELEACRAMIAGLRARFPDVPIVFAMGNHEERWNHWLWQHAPEISDEPMMSLAAWLHLDRHGVELVDEQRPVMVGRLPVMHGHQLPKGLAAPVNVARGAFLRTLTSVMVGHSHRTSGHCEADMWHSEIYTWSTGCLCNLRPEYARINRWNWGAAIVDVAADGEYQVENFRISPDGKVRLS